MINAIFDATPAFKRMRLIFMERIFQRRPVQFLIMSVKSQFVKCILCVVLYLTICFLLLKLKQSYESVQLINMSRVAKTVVKTVQHYSRVPTVKKRSAKAQIKLLQRDELSGQSINVKENAMILQRMSDVCARDNLKTPLIKRHFLYNSEHRSFYCWIRKAASTSFTKLFSDMRHRRVSHDYYKEVNFLSPRTLEELKFAANDTKTFKFLIVRHPFHRLVSSYRDRIADNTKDTAQAWIYTEKIFNLTRPQLFRSNATTGNFHTKVFTPDRRLKIVPTFREFSEWLIRYPDEEDVHWSRYYNHCAVCNISYNYVLKLDDYTLGEINYIFSKLSLDRNKVYLPELERTRGGHTNFSTTCKYLRGLSRDMILKLYERYKTDFEMYNYKLNEYVYCANRKH